MRSYEFVDRLVGHDNSIDIRLLLSNFRDVVIYLSLISYNQCQRRALNEPIMSTKLINSSDDLFCQLLSPKLLLIAYVEF